MLILSLIIGGVLLLIVSLIVNIFLIKALLAQLKNVEQYKSLISEYDQWTDKVSEMINSTYLKIKIIDDKNIFEKDDEVGVVFQDLLNIIKILNDRIKQ